MIVSEPYDSDQAANNAVATGAVMMLFVLGSERAPGKMLDVKIPEDGPGNELLITFDFLASPYRITVERVRDE